MLLQVSSATLRRLDFERAVSDEIGRPIDSLPSRTVEGALAGHESDYARHLAARCATGVEVEPQEVVWTPKAGLIGRYRPVSALSVDARVILRALTNDILPDVPPFERSPAAQDAFQKQPLEAGTDYIVVADIASFYFFVDHAALASRIVDTSARADTADAVGAVLDALHRRAYGLPQNFGPSEVLSELYVAPVERRLVRAGIVTYRNNDDFRLCADTWGEALQSLERLQDEVSAVGLDLNAEKTWILKQETYAENLRLADKYFRTAFARAYIESEELDAGGGDLLTIDEADLLAIDPYTGEPIPSDDEDEDEDEMWSPEEDESAPTVDDELPDEGEPDADDSPASGVRDDLTPGFVHAFQSALERRASPDRQLNGFENVANRRVISAALRHLGAVCSDAAVDGGAQLLALEPVTSRQYSAYLIALGGEGETQSRRVVRALSLFRGHAPYWTQAWLMEPLMSADVDIDHQIEAWLRSFLSGPAPGVFKARAALVLAYHGMLDSARAADLIAELPSAARPDAAFALALTNPSSAVMRAVALEDRLLRIVLEHASSVSA